MTPLSPESPEPLYLQLARELRSAIQRGELEPGQRLPPERDLVATYGVSRETVRQGLDVVILEAGPVWAGYGTLKPCVVCRGKIADDEIQYDVVGPRGSLPVHVKCSRSWRVRSNKLRKST